MRTDYLPGRSRDRRESGRCCLESRHSIDQFGWGGGCGSQLPISSCREDLYSRQCELVAQTPASGGRRSDGDSDASRTARRSTGLTMWSWNPASRLWRRASGWPNPERATKRSSSSRTGCAAAGRFQNHPCQAARCPRARHRAETTWQPGSPSRRCPRCGLPGHAWEQFGEHRGRIGVIVDDQDPLGRVGPLARPPARQGVLGRLAASIEG